MENKLTGKEESQISVGQIHGEEEQNHSETLLKHNIT